VQNATIQCAHTAPYYFFGKDPTFAFGCAIPFGMNYRQQNAWMYHGGGMQLMREFYKDYNIVNFPAGNTGAQMGGFFRKEIKTPADFKGLKFRTVGLSIDIFTAMGAAVNALSGGEIVAALDRGLLDAAEFNNASSDKALGFPDVAKVCMLKSWHQSAEQFEIIFNKGKYDALPPKLKAIIANAVEAASADMSWKAIDRYSKDYIELQKMNVKFYATPATVLNDQLKIWDEVVAKKESENPMFKKVNASMRAFAERATKWQYDTNNDYRVAVNHYFGQQAGGAAKKT
jgi:TRAP-type mannitol/chloroaromatic compound transport system substrate-binding protein